MSNLFLESFSYQDANGGDFIATGVPSSSTGQTLTVGAGAFGEGNAVRAPFSDTQNHRVYLPTDPSEIFYGGWIYISSIMTSSSPWARILVMAHQGQGYTNGHAYLETSIFGGLRMVSDTSTVLAETPSRLVGQDEWVFVEVRLLVSASVGEVEIRVDGVSHAATTGLNTLKSGAVDKISYLSIDGGATVFHGAFYVNDSSGVAPNNTFWGPIRVSTLRPNGPGFSAGFTPLTGPANWQDVDDTNFSADATYNSASAPGTIDSHTYDSLPYAPDTIYCVGLNTMARKDDLPGDKSLRSRLRSGGADALGAVKVLIPTDYHHNRQVVELDPNGDIPWTVAAVNAAEGGYEVVV